MGIEILNTWEDIERIHSLLDRSIDLPLIREEVNEIIQDVKKRGDSALLEYTERFDGVRPSSLRIEKERIDEAFSKIEDGAKEVMRKAVEKIKRFHLERVPSSWKKRFEDGVILGQYYRPIESVGVYVPGGRAPLFSTLLMACVPAKVAGVGRVVVTTPPTKDGVNPYILAASKIVEVDEVYCVGGAQAIAGLAFGTSTIQKVDKVVGPGNIYVTTAKALLYGVVGVDLLAGPSEVTILADDGADPDLIISEILAQAEHGPDSSGLLITTSKGIADYVSKRLPDSQVTIIISRDLREGISLVNRYGPEHLVILTRDPWDVMEWVKNAGAVFIGENSPVACGDYIAGPSHVLPTGGAARFSSGLGIFDFVKSISVISYERNGLEMIGEDVIRMARIEGLTAHANSIKVRMGWK